jgi:hypothetical protein
VSCFVCFKTGQWFYTCLFALPVNGFVLDWRMGFLAYFWSMAFMPWLCLGVEA